MNNQRSVYNRLFSKEEKTELESQKVELGLIDDLNKALVDSDAVIKELQEKNKRIDMWNKSIEKNDKESTKLYDKWTKAFNVYQDLEDKYLQKKRESQEAKKKYDSTLTRVEDDFNEKEKEVKGLQPLLKKGSSIVKILNDKISKADKMAKDLGIKIPTKKYQSALEKLKKLI